jgi:autotransporter family porin
MQSKSNENTQLLNWTYKDAAAVRKKQKKKRMKLSNRHLLLSAGLLLSAATSVYGATDDTASGAFADNGSIGTAAQGTYGATTSGSGILSATSGGQLSVTSEDVQVTNSGNPRAFGIYANGPGSIVTVKNATVRTTDGAGSWMSTNDGLFAANGGIIDVQGRLDLATVGQHSAGIRANNPGSLVNAHDVFFTGTGNAATGLWAASGGQIHTGNVGITIKSSSGTYGYGILADGIGSMVTTTGGSIMVDDSGGTSNSAVRAINNGTVTATGPITIQTNGNGARGVYASGGGAINLSDAKITTTGTISNGIEVGKTVDATGVGSGAIHADGAIDVVVSGINSIALALQAPAGTGSHSEFTTTSTSTTKLRAGSGPVIAYQGGNNSTVDLYNVDIATANAGGSNAVISVGKNYTVTSIADLLKPPAVKTTNAVLNLHNGTVKAGTSGSLIDVTNGSDLTVNADKVTLTGITTKDATSILNIHLNNDAVWNLAPKGTAASGKIATFNDLDLNSGSILDASGNAFTLNGNVNNDSGVINLVKGNNTGTTLSINGVLSQRAGGALNLALGSSPIVTATSADLAGTLNIVPSSSSSPAKSSEIPLYQTTIIHTTDGITGDFDTINTTGTNLDYLVLRGSKVADDKDYNLGLKLAWTDGGYGQGTGNFTIASGASFEVDTVLADQAAPFADWDGKSLVKKGEGLLILSAVNTYSGSTTIEDGTLSLAYDSVSGGDGSIAGSSGVVIHGGVLDISALHDGATTIQNLSGTGGQITLGGNNLTITLAENHIYAGDIAGAGKIIKEGIGTLTLTGDAQQTGGTTITTGTLQIGDGGASGSIAGDIFNNGILAFDRKDSITHSGVLSGTGELMQKGSGATILDATGSKQGSVVVQDGVLSFLQTGAFTVTGGYTTESGATTNIGTAGSTLDVGTFTQKTDSNLVVTIDNLANNRPSITAGGVSLDGNLFISGFSDNATPVKSSEIPETVFTLIRSQTAIDGNFTNHTIDNQLATGLGYLINDGGFIAAAGKEYQIGFRLAWTDGGYNYGSGAFDMAAGTSFEVDTVFGNQAGPFANWDGKTLTKSGDGLLILSAANTYDGSTTINGGTLALQGDGDISSSGNVVINGGIFDIGGVDNGGATIQNLSGAGGQITLGDKDLSIAQGENGTYAGDITGNGGISKEGVGELVLKGQANWTGNTTINDGVLTLDGSNGGGQLVGDVAGQAGGTLKASNGASLTGTIDAVNVNINSGATWNVTASSNVQALNSNNGNITFMAPADSTNPLDYKTIKATNLTGENGSIITMNTNLAANIGDLIVTEATSGKSTIMVNNTGGGISGEPQSLEVIEVTNPSQSLGTFTLGNPNGVVDLGNYKFHLVTGDKIQEDPWSWYLAVLGNSDRTQAIVAAADQAGAWLISTESLLQRMGELRITDYSKSEHGWQSWARGYSWQGNVTTVNDGAEYKSAVYGTDIGMDKTRRLKDGRLSTGGFVGIYHDRRDIENNAGRDEINSIYGGLYGTWIRDNGFYVDVVGKAGHLKTDVNASGVQQYSKGSFNNWGLLGSVELGRQLKNDKGWFIEPQAQGTYVHFTDASYAMRGSEAKVEQDASNSFDLRAGIVAGRTIKTKKSGTIQPYIKGMYGHTWTNGGDVSINGDSFAANSAGNRLEAGAGLAWQINGKNQVYVDYTYTNGDRVEVPWRASIGYRVTW